MNKRFEINEGCRYENKTLKESEKDIGSRKQMEQQTFGGTV
jgi:hypothetical protein